MRKNRVLLSFDIEEFDFPRERGMKISVEKGVKISSEGTEKILTILKQNDIKATFFVTGNFAKTNPELVRKIAENGHEVACHGVDHFAPKPSDSRESKEIVEKVIGKKVHGYRQPRMFKIDYKELEKCGFAYDSSVNPVFIPGRYNNLKTPRTPFTRDGVREIPTSTATFLRIPLFWLAFHLFPKRFYLSLVRSVLKRQGYFTTYFHPWEFTDFGKFKVPWYIAKNSGDKLVKRLDWLIKKLKQDGHKFITYNDFEKETK